MGIFKEYDIRGIYPSEIDERIFYRIGAGAKRLGILKIAVGRDGRASSESLHRSLVQGLIDSGVDVFDIGLVTSPMLSLFCVKKKVYGAMITASHNPPEFNGVKIVNQFGVQLSFSEGLNKIEKNLDDSSIGKKIGRVRKMEFYEEYRKIIYGKFRNAFARKLRVVFDCSNGVGFFGLRALKGMNIGGFFINEKVDGRFPNHLPDQTRKENLKQLQKEVVRRKADLGVMLDGDADRCAFVDEKGGIVSIDLAFLLLALEEIKNSKVSRPLFLCDLRMSKVVGEEIKYFGGEAKVMRVGNPFYKRELHKNKRAVLAGEYSGHIMFTEHYGVDDSIFASLKMISLLSKRDESFSECIASHKKYFSSGEISYVVRDKDKIFNLVKQTYSKFKLRMLDGISAELGDAWFTMRKSNTEDKIRLVVEGKSRKAVEGVRKGLESVLKNG